MKQEGERIVSREEGEEGEKRGEARTSEKWRREKEKENKHLSQSLQIGSRFCPIFSL